MRFGILGPMLVHDGDAFIDVVAPRQRTLLAALLVQAGQPVPVDKLTETLWDGEPRAAAAVTVRTHVMRLRQVLGPGPGARLLTRSGCYLLEASADEVDFLLFAALCRKGGAAAEAGEWREADRALSGALELWRGVPLADISSDLLRADITPHLEELRLQALEWRNDARLWLAGHAELIPQLQALVADHPLRERFQAQLMLALYRAGCQADALAAFLKARTHIAAELGIEPGPELRELQHRILAADESLAVRYASSVASSVASWRTGVVPRQLPATVTNFTGRQRELAEMTAALDRAGSESAVRALVISAISGTAGVGKTALALHWAHHAADRFPDGQLYVNLRGYDPDPPVLPADVLAGFLQALGVHGPEIPAGLDQRSALYRSMLHGRRVIVLLDNARDAEQLRPLLPGASSCVAVVTCRNSLTGLVAREGAWRLDLDGLPPADAVSLLRALIGRRVDAEPDAAAVLASFCCGLPLALRVAAELAVSRPDVALADLVGELAELQHRLDRLDADGDPHTAVRTVISWSYKHLHAASALAFRLIGEHPGTTIDALALAALVGDCPEHAGKMLDELGSVYLVQPAGPGRYSMHDLLRAFARELAVSHDSPIQRQTAMTRLLDYYVPAVGNAIGALFAVARDDSPRSSAFAGSSSARDDALAARVWLDAEHANLIAVIGHATNHGWPDHATKLAGMMFRYLDSSGHYAEASAIHAHARIAGCQAGDRIAEANALTNLAVAEARQCNHQQAIEHLCEALALFREMRDLAGEARALGNIGTVHLRLSRYQDAVGYLQDALPIIRAAGRRSGEASVLNNLGLACLRMGRYQQAIEYLSQSLKISRETSSATSEARALTNIADIEMRQGKHATAASHLRQSLTLFGQAGDRVGEAYALTSLGDLNLRRGNQHDATSCHEQALSAFRELSDRSGQATALNGLAEAHLAAGNVSAARNEYTAACQLARQISERHLEARAQAGLSNVCRAEGNDGQC